MHLFLLFLAAALVPFVHSLPVDVGVERRGFSFPLAPRFVIISMFTPEQAVWIQPLGLTYNITVPGLSPLYPDVHCDEKGWICQFTTGESEINAAASTTALFFSHLFDFRLTYFMIAGIAGGNPHVVTLGSATFSRFAVQVALSYEMDPREAPSNWTTGYWSFGTDAPDMYPGYWYGTEVFELNTNLLARVMDLVKDVKLNDTTTAAAFRAKYDYAPANAYPTIVQCDVATSDVYYTGAILSEAFGNITKTWTNGTGNYCATAQEDNATLESAVRATLAGRVDYSRFIVLRTISDFDRPPPSLTTLASIETSQGGGPLSRTNIYTAGWPIVKEIVYDWEHWKAGTPHQNNDTGYGDVLGSLL